MGTGEREAMSYVHVILRLLERERDKQDKIPEQSQRKKLLWSDSNL